MDTTPEKGTPMQFLIPLAIIVIAVFLLSVKTQCGELATTTGKPCRNPVAGIFSRCHVHRGAPHFGTVILYLVLLGALAALGIAVFGWPSSMVN